jgi:hypothetical protein
VLNTGAIPPDFTYYTLVCTSDGSGTEAGLKVYVNGPEGTYFTGSNGAGTTGVASSESLYLGRRRFDTALSNNGVMTQAVIAGRTWTDAEARAFYENPWQIYEPVRNTLYSFLGVASPGTPIDVTEFPLRRNFID